MLTRRHVSLPVSWMPAEDMRFLGRGQRTLLLTAHPPSAKEGPLSLSSKAAYCTNVLEKTVWNKRAIHASVYKMSRNARDHEGSLPTGLPWPPDLVPTQCSRHALYGLCLRSWEFTSEWSGFVVHREPGSSLMLGAACSIYLPYMQ